VELEPFDPGGKSGARVSSGDVTDKPEISRECEIIHESGGEIEHVPLRVPLGIFSPYFSLDAPPLLSY